MKKFAPWILVALSTQFAQARTIHDYCVDPENAAHYASYDECREDRLERRKSRKADERERKSQLLNGIQRANKKLFKSMRNHPKTTRCETIGNETTCTEN